MTKLEVRPEATGRADYEADFFAWTREQAQLLRARATPGLDWTISPRRSSSMGRRDRRKLESRFRRILHHLLKWQAQPGLRGPNWRRTLSEQRRQAEKLLEESLSLRPQIAELIEAAYPDQLTDALDETGLRAQTFPVACPFTPDQVLDPGYFPEEDG